MGRTLKWIDGHAHLSDPRLEPHLKRLLEEAMAVGIEGWVLAGTDPQEWEKQRELVSLWPDRLFPVFGLHPWKVHGISETEVLKGIELLKKELPLAKALGETGLDAFEDRAESLSLQKFAFEAQLALAQSAKKPLVLHIVQAHSEAKAFLKGNYQGIIHSFSGSAEDAKFYCDKGFFLSFSGTITRPGHLGPKDAVRALPLEKIIIETDAPDQKPHHFGKALNEPVSLLLVAEAVAALKGVSKEEVLDQSTRNIRNVFNL